MKSFRFLVAALAMALAGCGGGGDGGAPSNELTIGAPSPSSITANVSDVAGTAGRSIPLSATYSGTLSGTVYVVVEDPDAVFSGANISYGIGTVMLNLVMSDTAPAGRYTRPIVVHVCRDATCASEFGGFPRTIPKDVTIRGTAVGTAALTFTSTAGAAAPAQNVTITPPTGLDFTIDGGHYFQYFEPGSSTSGVVNLASVLQITRTSTGISVRPNGTWAGRYTGVIPIATPGHATRYVQVDYQVGAATGPVLTPLTTSVSASGPQGSSADVFVNVDFLRNMGTVTSSFVQIDATGGTVDPGSTFWVRYYDFALFQHGTGPADNAQRLRFAFRPCFITCMPMGTYTANIVLTAQAYGQTSTHTVPVTFTITP